MRFIAASPTPSHCLVCCCLVVKLCPSLCNPMDHSPPGSSVHGCSQARILEWVAISSSRGSSPPRDGTHGSCLSGKFFITEPPGKPLATHWLPGAQQCPGCFPVTLWPAQAAPLPQQAPSLSPLTSALLRGPRHEPSCQVISHSSEPLK